jgi:hypothetical protein
VKSSDAPPAFVPAIVKNEPPPPAAPALPAAVMAVGGGVGPASIEIALGGVIDSNTVERSIRGLALNRNYAQVRIMRSCRSACAESPVDRPVGHAGPAPSCA